MRPQRVGHNWATERLFVDWRSFSRAKRCLTLRWRKSHINCVFFYSVKPEVTLSSISLLMLSQAVKVHSTNVIVLYGSRYCDQFSSVQFLNCIWLFATPWTAACQASLSITISCSLLKLMSIESVMPSSHLILCHPLLLQNYCLKVPHVQGQRIPSKTVGAGAVAVMHWRNCDQIPHVQGQRRSPGKTVGGAKSHLEANPVPSREAQWAQTNLVCTRSQRPQRDWDRTVVGCLLRRYGQQWTEGGQGLRLGRPCMTCLTQWDYEPRFVGPPKMDSSWGRVLTKRGPLEMGMANHLSVLALRTPWTAGKCTVIETKPLALCSLLPVATDSQWK